MSQENVGVVAKGFDALNRGDFDGLLYTYAPDVEFVTDARAPSVPMRGRDAVRSWLEDLATAWVERTLRFSTLEPSKSMTAAWCTGANGADSVSSAAQR